MTIDVSNLRPTIVPRSDQLNSEELIGRELTIVVSRVEVTGSNEQPVSIHYEGCNGKPYKPAKTMRKVLINAWGEDGRQWVGKSMTLYCDQSVRFGGAEVGGIRISHMSDIPGKVMKLTLLSTKGKKAVHEIKRLETESPSLDALMIAINNAGTVESLKAAFAAAYKATKHEQQRATFKAAYDDRLRAIAEQEPQQ
jgi:hypothetical protein